MNVKTFLATSMLIAPTLAFAQQEVEPQKHFSIGVASYATVIGYSDNGDDDSDAYSGPALIATGAINDHVAFRITYAAQEETDDSDYSVDALEGAVLLGTGLSTQGFRAYGALGLFNETHEYQVYRRSYEQDVNGYTLGGGLGYSWSYVTLDFWLSVRDTSDYEDSAPSLDDLVAVSGGLGVSARF
ncbi:outer membrane beta-barrel protein [uncultured Gilvimarinus sp.]|uniref:outer membrane beta-barrel protein n=1 Tax=uncultured Gilvimarinus sp. TaxID=1689143 RepID=UPI0030D9A19F